MKKEDFSFIIVTNAEVKEKMLKSGFQIVLDTSGQSVFLNDDLPMLFTASEKNSLVYTNIMNF